MRCPANKIINPKTGRCVLKKGSIGQQILKRRRQKSARRSARKSRRKRKPSPLPLRRRSVVRCPSNKIRNPATGRCVLKKGSIGQTLLKQGRGKKEVDKNPKVHEFDYNRDVIQEMIFTTTPLTNNITQGVLKKYGQNVLKAAQKAGFNIRFLRRFKGGAFGDVYEVVNDDNKHRMVVKIEKQDKRQFTEKEFYDKQRQEFRMHERFHKVFNTPKPFFIEFFQHKNSLYSIMGMSMLSMLTLDKLLARPLPLDYLKNISQFIRYIIQYLCQHGLVHGDLHWGNFSLETSENTSTKDFGAPFVFTNNEVRILQPVLLDFGFAEKRDCFPELEILQLLRTTYMGMHPFNAQYLREELLNLYEVYAGRREKNKLLRNNKLTWPVVDRAHTRALEVYWNE
jgi:hypothetical protein